MWVFLNNAFLSIVENKDNSDELMVRARLRGDIERVFPGEDVRETPTADYRFRASIDRHAVADAIRYHVLQIDYLNFKKSVQDQRRHDTYLQVWSQMWNAQEDERMGDVRFPLTQSRLGRALKAGAVYVNPRGKKAARPR